jgi:hypothetical protein
MLFSIFTYDCVAEHAGNLIVKFADDTTVTGLISNNDESAYRDEISNIVEWCNRNNLCLNVEKTKEIVIDYRKTTTVKNPLLINGQMVEIVHGFKYLGILMNDEIKWEEQLLANLKKAQKRLYFLRQLKTFHISQDLMINFYRSTIESCLTNFIITWYKAASKKDINRLSKVIKTASYIIGTEMESLHTIYEKRTLKRVTNILKDDFHPTNDFLEFLPSRKRLRSILSSTNRLSHSFIPSAVRLFNGQRL